MTRTKTRPAPEPPAPEPPTTYELRNDNHPDHLFPKWRIRRNGRIVKRSDRMGMEGKLWHDMHEMAEREAIRSNRPVEVVSHATESRRVVTPEEAIERREAIRDICRRALAATTPDSREEA